MAAYSFDFNKIERRYFKVTLKDYVYEKDGKSFEKKGEELILKMPTKRTFSKITSMKDDLNTESMSTNDAFDTMAALMSEILSNNMTGKFITAKIITANYDFQEMATFIDAYAEFIKGEVKNPN